MSLCVYLKLGLTVAWRWLEIKECGAVAVGLCCHAMWLACGSLRLLLLLFPGSSQEDFRKESWSEPGTEKPLQASRSKVWFWNCLMAAETVVVDCETVLCYRLVFGANMVLTRRATF